MVEFISPIDVFLYRFLPAAFRILFFFWPTTATNDPATRGETFPEAKNQGKIISPDIRRVAALLS